MSNKNEFKQFIYARGNYNTDLQTGQTRSGSEGFGIYLAPKGGYANEASLEFLKDTLSRQLRSGSFTYTLLNSRDNNNNAALLLRSDEFEERHDPRGGEFVNQAYMGDYSVLYPCTLFEKREAWDAYDRGVSYCYEHPPKPENATRDLKEIVGDTCLAERFEEVGAFISESSWRRNALISGVAFLMQEYQKPKHKRRFLVISAESEGEVEKWVSAIHFAFPPKMAACISFTTNEEKSFWDKNNCYIDKNGFFTNQDISKPFPKYMLVGNTDNNSIGEWYKGAGHEVISSNPKRLAHFKEKAISFEFVKTVTSFDQTHWDFLPFAQKLLASGVCEPTAELFDIHEMYADEAVRAIVLNTNLRDIGGSVKMVKKLRKYAKKRGLF
ncbi:MAG: hypothetical protein FWG63_04645 [Defluviitaleaceae bacterium]|nr:hypothetical protein [Defluviitaleaceae bacterium]